MNDMMPRSGFHNRRSNTLFKILRQRTNTCLSNFNPVSHLVYVCLPNTNCFMDFLRANSPSCESLSLLSFALEAIMQHRFKQMSLNIIRTVPA